MFTPAMLTASFAVQTFFEVRGAKEDYDAPVLFGVHIMQPELPMEPQTAPSKTARTPVPPHEPVSLLIYLAVRGGWNSPRASVVSFAIHTAHTPPPSLSHLRREIRPCGKV